MRNKLNLILGIVSIIAGAVGILDFLFVMGYGAALNFGIIFPLIFGIFLIIYGILRLTHLNSRIINNKILRVSISTAASLFLISFIIIESYIYMGTKQDSYEDIDYVVVLGAGLKGRNVTATLKYRLDKTIDILNENKEIKAVVTGGKGYEEEITEASAMKDYLIKNGIESGRIILEDRATSTYENFKYTKELLDTYEEKIKILIITSDFHMARSKLIAKKAGFAPSGAPAETYKYLLPNSIIREYFAFIKSLIFREI